MKELVIISGKGGTGKTSLIASFAALSKNKGLADTDVDAPDLHLILSPNIKHEEAFRGGHKAIIDKEKCTECGECQNLCRFEAISEDFVVDNIACEGCGVCVHFCPAEAISFPQKVCGKWFISDTRFGPMVHAQLGIAEENSGLLATLVRNQARIVTQEKGLDLILTDGPPGIGCPVIATVAGASAAMIITEPTISGRHDLQRVYGLTQHFQIPALVCINKFDLNEYMTEEIEKFCKAQKIPLGGKIPFDPKVTEAVVDGKTIVEYTNGSISEVIAQVWQDTYNFLKSLP